MAIDIKFTKFDNTPWGFRLAGGSDFPQPLTVIRVTEGSLAECMGLQTGDVVVRLNDQPLSGLTHGRAHEALVLAGNNFVLGVLRGEDSRKAVETIREENCVPYTIPLETLPPVFPEEPKEETSEEPSRETEENATPQPLTETAEPAEEYPQKPVSADSELVANKNLTDEEIAQLILEEEELLSEQGVLGVNFKKLRPRAPFLKDSKVFEELHKIAVAEPPQIQELKRTTTFLQKPERPVPQPAKKEPDTAAQVEAYRVIIKKQQKKSVAERLIEKGLLEPGAVKTPETRSEKTTPSTTPEPAATRESSRPASRVEETRQVTKIEEICSVEGSVATDVDSEQRSTEARIEEVEDSREDRSEEEEEVMSEVVPMIDKEKIKELVSTEISLEKQLENVQSQLLALKQLPSEIENHLRIVSEQLHKIMELSGVGSRRGSDEEQQKDRKDNRAREDDKERETSEDDDESQRDERDREEDHQRQSDTDDNEERTYVDRHEDGRSDGSSLLDGESTRIVESDTDHSQERKELEISVKSPTEGRSVKKFIVSYESKVIKSREPSPARSERSFEPDPNLSPKDQVIQELQHRKGRKHSHDLWPQAKQLELTFGRRWRCPNDFFNDEMIAEVLSSQAEVLNGKAMGINFKKYEKKHLPNYDHLMNSGVYKMVHKMEHEPKRGIPVRPPKVNAAEDILERVKSPALSVEEDGDNRSARGARHLTNPQPCNRS